MHTKRDRFRPLVLVLGVGAALAVVVLRWTDAVAVRGSSMVPTLEPGDLLLVERLTFRRRSPRLGDVVLARDPGKPSRELIKRVWAVGDAGVELRGDGTASTDSRAFGGLPFDAVAWRVVFRYWPLARFGPVAEASAPAQPLGGEPACSTFGDLVVAFDSVSESS